MKLVICGSRKLEEPYEVYEKALDDILSEIHVDGDSVSEVVSGGCRGADMFGERWARKHKIPIRRFEADWEQWGKAAGPIRNKEMVLYADGVIALWDGKSTGTRGTIRLAASRGKLWNILGPVTAKQGREVSGIEHHNETTYGDED